MYIIKGFIFKEDENGFHKYEINPLPANNREEVFDTFKLMEISNFMFILVKDE